MEILIVDDKPENLYLLESLIKGSGFETISARNGAEALGLAKKNLPDIIISDILMPVMDGYTFCIECKKDDQLKKIPFIFYTATYTNPKDRDFALSIGADKFLLKPLEPDALIEIINNCITKRNSEDNEQTSDSPLSESEILKEYNETLIRKLEDKMRQTEESEDRLKKYVKQLEDSLTERIKIENALKESEEHNRLILENSMDAILLTSPDGKVFSANKAACEMFQMTEEEICRAGRDGLVDLSDARLKYLLEKREREGKAHGELNFVRKDKSVFPTEVSSSIFIDSNGNRRTSMVIRDITERKQSIETLRESESFIRAVMDNLPVGIAVNTIDPAVNFQYMNDNFAKIYRTTREALSNSNSFWEAVYEDEDVREEMKKRVLADCTSGNPELMHWEDIPITRKGKETTYVSAMNFPLPERKLMISMVWDVTDRKRAEDALLYEQYLLHTLMEYSPDSIYFKDKQSRFIRVNRIMARLFDLNNPEDAVGKTDFDFFSEEHAESAFKDEQKIIKTGKAVINIEEKETWPNGSISWVSTSKIPLHDKSGNINGTFGISRNITERKLHEENIRINAERTQRLLKIYEYNSPNIQDFLDYSLDEAIELTSSKAGCIFFYNEEKDEFILSSFSDRHMKISNSEEKQFLANFDKAEICKKAIERKREIIENNFVTKEGDENYQNSLLRYLTIPMLEGDKIIAVVGVVNKESDYDKTDAIQLKLLMNSVWKIVQRKEAEDKALILSKVIEQSPTSIVITDPNSTIEYVNPSFTKMTGYTFEESIGKTPRILKSGHHTKEFYKNLWTTLIEGKDWKGEFLNKKKNGELYWETAIISAIVNEEGKITHFVEVKEDVTQKKKAEELIRTQNELLQVIFDNIPVMITRLEPGSGKFTVNREFEEKIGWADSSSDFYSLLEKCYPDPVYRKSIEEYIRKAEAGWKEMVMSTESGKELYAIWSNIKLQEGSEISIGVDITDRKAYERDLIRAKEQAEKSDKLKTEFLAQISHEIRSPMNAIISFVSLAADELENKFTPELLEYFEGINSAGKRLMRTIELVVNASEMQLGIYNPVPTHIELIEDIFKTLNKEYSESAAGKGLGYHFHPETEKAEIIGDSYSVIHIFHNLIDNAIKYTEKGKIDIFVKKAEDGYIEVSVNDTGIGMSEPFMENLFQPFTQEDQGYSRRYEGSGLGLSLVKYFCSLNRATVNVSSEKNKGSIFTVRFPMAKKFKK